MTFVWSKDYLWSAAVLGKSLTLHQSEHPLVVVIPASVVRDDKNQVTLRDLARLSEHVHRVVVVQDLIESSPAHQLFQYDFVFAKFLAFNFVEFDVVAVIDADSIILRKEIDLVFKTKTNFQHFLGVGSGVMPGSFFVIQPNIKLLNQVIETLSMHHNYRMHEMGLINILFGSAFQTNHHHYRLPSTASCTAVGPDVWSTCRTFDMAFCKHKPWDIQHFNETTMIPCDASVVVASTQQSNLLWTRAVRQWKAIERTLNNTDDQTNQTKRRQYDHETFSSCMAMVRSQDNGDATKVQLVVSLCATRTVCVRSAGAMRCSLQKQGTLEFSVNKVHDIGDHRIILYCMDPAKHARMVTLATHEELMDACKTCGKIEYSYKNLPLSSIDMMSFESAQSYVSGGGKEMALKKWKHSGRAQFNILQISGLRSFHRVLEFGCGTLGLARHLFSFMNEPQAYHCVEPNDYLIQASVNNVNQSDTERKIFKEYLSNATIHKRSDFGSGLTLPLKFDVVVAHSVLSHAGTTQWHEFFSSLKKHLTKEGVALVSLCFCSACEKQPRQFETQPRTTSCTSSHDLMWVYPYVSWWTETRVKDMAAAYGLQLTRRKDLREIMISQSPADNHDWMSVTHLGFAKLEDS